jgi:uncharacterized membrane protein
MLELIRDPLSLPSFVLHTIIFSIGVATVFVRREETLVILLRIQAILLGVSYLALGLAWNQGALLVLGGVITLIGGLVFPFVRRRNGDPASGERPAPPSVAVPISLVVLGVVFLGISVGLADSFFPAYREAALFVPFDLLALVAALGLILRRDTAVMPYLGALFFIHAVLVFGVALAPVAPTLLLAVMAVMMTSTVAASLCAGYLPGKWHPSLSVDIP